MYFKCSPVPTQHSCTKGMPTICVIFHAVAYPSVLHLQQHPCRHLPSRAFMKWIIQNGMFIPTVGRKLIWQSCIVQAHWAYSKVLRDITSRTKQKANWSNSFLDSAIALGLRFSGGDKEPYNKGPIWCPEYFLLYLVSSDPKRFRTYIQYSGFYYLASLHHIKDSGQMGSLTFQLVRATQSYSILTLAL